MVEYLGETPIKIKDTEFKNFTPKDWALYFIKQYGGIDGAHHKDWTLDQVVRVLNGVVPKLSMARWSNGKEEIRVDMHTVEVTEDYAKWVTQYEDGEEGPETYSYETGIAP